MASSTTQPFKIYYQQLPLVGVRGVGDDATSEVRASPLLAPECLKESGNGNGACH